MSIVMDVIGVIAKLDNSAGRKIGVNRPGFAGGRFV
jgi:hypothetical protein